MIRHEERDRTVHELVPVQITCDVCGQDATGRRFGSGIRSSRFELAQRITLEKQRLAPHAAINETVVTHAADLCEACAAGVAAHLRRRADENGRARDAGCPAVAR